jgi:hypothetical protein
MSENSIYKAKWQVALAWAVIVVAHFVQICGAMLMWAYIQSDDPWLLVAAFAAIGISVVVVVPTWLNVSVFGLSRSWLGTTYPRSMTESMKRAPAFSGAIRIEGRFRLSAPCVAWRVGEDGFAASIPVLGTVVILWSEVADVAIQSGDRLARMLHIRLARILHISSETGSPVYCISPFAGVILDSYSRFKIVGSPPLARGALGASGRQ